MDKSKVAILTTVANFELYKVTSQLFPKDIQKYVFDGRNGMHGIHSIFYMHKKLSKKNIDWLILVDEDVIFKDRDIVFSIIDKMEKERISVAGVRDGGVVAHRQYNPFMVNTFFTIINFNEVVKIWNKKEIRKNQYILPSEFEAEQTLLNGVSDADSLYEPYYCFFLWLKRKGKKFLYLEAEMLDDNISNAILLEGKVFAFHTWYARSYGVNKKHTCRIDGILNSLDIEAKISEMDPDVEMFKDTFFKTKMKIIKIYSKIVNRLCS